MSNPRIEALGAAWQSALENVALHMEWSMKQAELFAAMYDAIRAYDAAHPPTTEQSYVSRDWCEEHNRGSLADTDGLCPDCEARRRDRSASPRVGGDPPWLDDMLRAWYGRDDIDLTMFRKNMRAVLRVAAAHLTDDAVVEAAAKALYRGWLTAPR